MQVRSTENHSSLYQAHYILFSSSYLHCASKFPRNVVVTSRQFWWFNGTQKVKLKGICKFQARLSGICGFEFEF